MNLQEILLSDDVVESINDNMDYLLQIIPELSNCIGFLQNHPHHHLDVLGHTLLALSMSKKDFDVRLCLLFHDIGKPLSYQDEEVRHFKNHEIISSEIAEKVLKRLGYNDDYIKYICHLIERHDTKITDEQIEEDYDFCLTLFEIQRCDALAHSPKALEKRKEYLRDTKLKLLKR